MATDLTTRRRELARRAREFYADRLPRSEVLHDVTDDERRDPGIRQLCELVQNRPKKSRFSGLWGRAWDAHVDRATEVIDTLDPGQG